MIASRSSTVNSGCLSTLIRIAIRTRSKMRSPRSTMSRWPFVIGSNEPGNTASELSRRLLFISPFFRAGRPGAAAKTVEAQAVVADARLPPAREAAYSLRKGVLVEVLGHRHAALVQQPRADQLQQRKVELARVGRVQVDDVEAQPLVCEGREGRPHV